MLELWSAPVYHAADDSDYGLHPVDRPEQEDRDRKRQRRSIFFAQPDSDSSDDGEDYDDMGRHRPFNCMNGKTDTSQTAAAVVPSTPYAADPLSKGACLLTPSFPRRSSSPCLGSANAFVAVHEEPNSGFRHYMEDRSAAMTADGVAYLGIYDGHGGVDASTFLQRHLLSTIRAHLHPGVDVHDALTAAYMSCNARFRETGSIQGSTATTVILKDCRLIAANVGDSPAFVVKKTGEVYSVIQEHKIEGEEAARIAAQGVPIYRSPTGPAYMGTPDGTRWLNMSRAFGDFVYPAISCEPHVCSLDVSDGKYLVMGSDGLTEKWPVAEAAQYLTQLASAGWSLPAICRSLVERSLAHGSTDNISCMIVDLEAYMLMYTKAAAPPTEAGEASADATAEAGGRAVSAGLQRVATAGKTDAASEPASLVAQRDAERQQQPAEDEWSLRCEEADGADLQQLLCKETSSGEELQPGVASCRPSGRSGVVTSGAALARCAASALGAATVATMPSSVRWRRVDVQVRANGSGAADMTEQSTGPSAVAECCLAAGAAADGDASPACSSPEVCDQQLRLSDRPDGEAVEGERQATPQPAQTACRVPTPVDDVEASTVAWAEGEGDG
ncbi:hypothetical protein PLESTB_000094300 [Pleodorina starrii]|uniref:protein-serine/threonine phosphatase n=1 Tax=Pleodorina starrii TaxID=330485 RepID=A0A9W6BAC2_9CHLO|nr:hypothetical protein PLESTB_000094300 [Pleodorina starrii]GLC71730.1 hypothetical protein PLESTF_001160000 [Pleodorina starrii]